jgi:filamentous hemagglutinin family protein
MTRTVKDIEQVVMMNPKMWVKRVTSVARFDVHLLAGSLLFFSLTLSPSPHLREAEAAAGSTSISPTGGTGSSASLGTLITSGSSTVPTNLCTASCVITGGTRAGTNLFHSFGDFSVGALDGARFQTGLVNPAPDASVTNILGRVTGGNVSSIFGNINSASFYPSANLFLMNPAGFLFGANATVNVGGMVAFTTADYLRLTDNARFNSVPNPTADALLSSAPVAAFGFIGSNPAAINFEGGQLTVAEGTGLALVGGDINLLPDSSGTPSGITASGRTLILTSVASSGEAAADTGIPAAGMSLGTITLDQGASLSTVGDLSVGDGSGGAISIRGGQLMATSANISSGPAEGSAGSGGAITIDVTDSATFTDSFVNTAPVAFSFAGSAGPVSITAGNNLTMTNTFIDASSQFAGGDGGSVALTASGLVSLTDSFIGTGAYETSAPGNGGAVTISGKDVAFNNSSIGTDINASPDVVSTASLGEVRPGSVNISAENTVTFSGSLFGDAGIPVINASALNTLMDLSPVKVTGRAVNLSNGTINVGIDNGSGAGLVSPGNAGTIEIRGNTIDLSQFNLSAANIGLFESTGRGGSVLLRGVINVRADSIHVTTAEIGTQATTGGGGGLIELQTRMLTISGGSLLRTETFGRGAGGTISVNGAENVTIESGSRVLTDAHGNTSPKGDFGTAGDILIETQNLALVSGGQIEARGLPLSTGSAGNITVQGTSGAANSILVDGLGSGIFSTTEGTGSGGNINLFANSVTVQNGGTLSAITSGLAPTATGGVITVGVNALSLSSGGTITAASTAAGPAGNIIVQGLASLAQSVSIDGSGSGIFTTTAGAGAGGNIAVNANSVALQNGARVSSSSTGAGVAGNIQINAGSALAMTNSSVTTEANQSSGGAIKITTNPDGTVQLTDSVISASVLDGTGGGGSVNIDPQFVILNHSSILANALFGPGGNIFITTNLLLPDSASIISASSQFGQQGTVIIQSPISPASGKITPLGQKPLLSTSLVNQRCAALAGGNSSSLTVAGRDTLPAEPGSWLSTPLALASVSENKGLEAKTEDKAPLLSLRQIAPPGFLTQVFAVESSGCQS